MKITRRQLRRLIKEAMFDPRAAREQAKMRAVAQGNIDQAGMKSLNALIGSDDEMNQGSEDEGEMNKVMGHDLLDTLGDYESPTGTGSSYQDIKDFDQEMTAAALENRRNQMHAMIPGLKEFEQAEAEREQRHRRRRASRNKPFINNYDKFVNILLRPEGIELWLSLQTHHLTGDDEKNKIYDLDRDIEDNPVLPDYLFTDPMWEGNIYIHALMSKIINDKSLRLTDTEWNEISETLSKLSGVRQMIVEFEILHFIHKFVTHTIEEIT